MPFGEDILDGDLSPPLVQSDLIGGSVEPESPVGQGSAPGRGLTVVTLDDQAGMNGSAAPAPEAELDIDAKDEAEVTSTAPAPPSTIKKRGRPSLSGPATPAKSVSSKTPTSTNSAAAPKSAGRSTGKRKAAESEPELKEAETTPARKRGRPARSAGSSASARLAAKAANKPTRGRPKSAAPAPKPAKKSGRAKKVTTNDEVPAGEYEVEEIVDSAIDADTLEHMYLVKWKNYPASENTWEPKKNLRGSLDLVREFHAKQKKAKAEEAAKKASAKKAAGPSTGEKKATRGRKAKTVKAVKKSPGRPVRKRRSRA